VVASLDGGMSVCVEYAGGESDSCNILNIAIEQKMGGELHAFILLLYLRHETNASSLKSCRNVTMSVIRLSKFFEMSVKSFEKAKIVR